jgi:hypothetical protein
MKRKMTFFARGLKCVAARPSTPGDALKPLCQCLPPYCGRTAGVIGLLGIPEETS